ncbi:MAG: O-antigen ligase family protein [Deltaproteobacteria bacterium]|nr:O-antigen ligase family protein [Candidatus Tharpella aukensis]
MAGYVKKRKRQAAAKPSRLASVSFFQKLPEILVWAFFAFSPLIFFSGLAPDGHPFFTLYDLPKFYFIISFTFLLAGFYFWSVAGDPLQAAALAKFLSTNWGIRLLVLWWLALFVSIFQALVPAAAFLNLFHYFSLLVLYLVLARLFSQPSRRWAAVYGLIGALIIFVPLGIFQYLGFQVPLLKPIFGPASTLGYRNPAAHFLALVLPFAFLAVWRHWRLWRAHATATRLFFFCTLLLVALAALALLFMNYSRTAIMALLIEALALPLVWLLAKKEGAADRGGKRRRLGWALFGSLLLVVLISLLIMVFPNSRKRVVGSYNKFKRGGPARMLEARYYHWGNTLMMIKEQPLTGVGLGNWRFSYPLYAASFKRDPLQNYKMQIRKTHNDYLQLAAECGIPALLLFLLLWGRQFYLLRYSSRESDGEEDWRLPLAASLLAFSVIMFFSFPMQMAYSRMFCFFLLALGEARAWPALLK